MLNQFNKPHNKTTAMFRDVSICFTTCITLKNTSESSSLSCVLDDRLPLLTKSSSMLREWYRSWQEEFVSCRAENLRMYALWQKTFVRVLHANCVLINYKETVSTSTQLNYCNCSTTCCSKINTEVMLVLTAQHKFVPMSNIV